MVTLELTQDDLYANGSITDYGDGTFVLDRPLITSTPKIGDDYYEVIQGDEYTNLAYLKYGNSKLWHVIAIGNNIINPFDELPNALVLPSNNINSFQ